MIEETGKVLAVEDDAVWVETIQRSTCQNCAAEKGCGQSVLTKAVKNTTAIRALLRSEERDGDYAVGDEVLIGVPEHIVVSGTMLLYLLPLLTMIVGVVVANQWSGSDGFTALGGLLGLLSGGFLVRFHSYRRRHDPDVQPVVIKRL